MNEFHLTSSNSKEQFRSFCMALEQVGGKLISTEDAQQLEYPLDQMYLDYQLQGRMLTLHYEHYLGIYLLSKEFSADELKDISLRLK